MPCGSTERKGSAEIGMLITDAQDLRILTVKALEGHNKYSPSKGNLCDIITHNIVGSNHGYLKTFWRRLNLLSPQTPGLELFSIGKIAPCSFKVYSKGIASK